MACVRWRKSSGKSAVEPLREDALNLGHAESLIESAGRMVMLHDLEIHARLTTLVEHAEYMGEQGAAESLAPGIGVYHQILEVGTGPALRHSQHLPIVQHDKAQLPVVLGIVQQVVLPLGECFNTAITVLIVFAEQGMNLRQQFIVQRTHVYTRWPLRRGQWRAQVLAQQQAVSLGHP